MHAGLVPVEFAARLCAADATRSPAAC